MSVSELLLAWYDAVRRDLPLAAHPRSLPHLAVGDHAPADPHGDRQGHY